MNTKTVSIVAISILMVMSCKETKKENTENRMENEMKSDSTATSITLEKLEGSPEYKDASLKMVRPISAQIEAAGELDFAFELQNYELGSQTDSTIVGMLSNSGKGQHIHFILDNQPYSAHYESEFKKELPGGTHYLVAFLSRSYHESVKNENSFVAKKMTVGDATNDLKVNFDEPTLIYSRPKGEYSGTDTENLLLDFFLLNTKLSKNGNKVRATINGNEFMLTDWVPYVVKGLPKGEVTITLELLNAEGNLISGGFNEVTRKVTLKE
jgi:hypothetical protein